MFETYMRGISFYRACILIANSNIRRPDSHMKVVLASRSPRRKQLLSLILESFEVRESHFDESTVIEEEPKNW